VNFTYTGKAVQSFFWDFGISSSNSDTSVFQNPSFTFPDTGTYAVKLVVNQNYSCADTLTINVTPPNPLMADFSLVSCSGDTVVFQDESVTNAYAGSITSWTWVYGDVSNNDFIQNPSHAYASPGTYVVTLIVTTANGCIDTLITSITTSPCEIIGQQELDTRDNDILVYPNPNNGLFTLDLSRFDLVGNMQLSVFSIDGQRIQSRSINGGSTPINIEVDLENNKKGIYFLKLVTDGEVVTKKIVLQ